MSGAASATATDNAMEQRKDMFIGKIPVRNIWVLQLYASELYKHPHIINVRAAENPDEIADLVAKLLLYEAERRRRRNLSWGYHAKEDILTRIRGRVNFLYTERRNLLSQGKIACHFDEATIDTVRNRYVRAALEEISNKVTCPKLRLRCRTTAGWFRRMGVTGTKPERSDISAERFGRHDLSDKPMVDAAEYAFELYIPTEEEGTRSVRQPLRDERNLRDLFEKAVAGFYKKVLSSRGWTVKPQRHIHWTCSDKSKNMILPGMITDIELHNPKGQRTVIDTKCNSLYVKSQYDRDTLRSGYIYQLYAYLRSQENSDDPAADNATGILLHPSVGVMIDEYAVIQGHKIRFATVDLTASIAEIGQQLLRIVGADTTSEAG